MAMSTRIRIANAGSCAKRPLVAERDHPLELFGSTIAGLASVDPDQHFTGVHEVAHWMWQDELGATGARPLDEPIRIDSLDRAASACPHNQCWLRAGRVVPCSHRISGRSAKRTV